MATKAASKRLGKESQLMERDPPPFAFARPREENVLDWHFILRGPPDTPYDGGEYHGQLLFPSDYPFKPPGIKMFTPSGRFHTDSKICTSMSDFHPGSWQPSWSVANILVGLLSFMCADEMTTGSVMATAADRATLAARSHAFNITQPRFKKMFPEYNKEKQIDLPNMGEIKRKMEESKTSTTTQSSSSDLKSKAKEGADTGTEGSTAMRDRNSTTIAPTHAIQAQGQIQEPARTKALLPLIIGLLAYLFLSRVVSTMSGAGPATSS